MEIEINSRKENPFLNRIEIRFTVKHKDEPTPSRELIRNELADRLNVSKDNVIIDKINTSFGWYESFGYAKIYNSLEKAKGIEKKYILKRNKIQVEEKAKKEEAAKVPAEKPVEKKVEEKQTKEETSKQIEENKG